MRFILYAPLDHIDPHGEFQCGEAARQIASALERAGVFGAFLTEHPAPDATWLRTDPAAHDALDPYVGLAFLAAASTKLRLMSSAVILPFRNPFLTAKAAVTLQVLSDHRFIMGVGVGYQEAEFAALGVAFKKRGALMDEALETIRLAWKGGPVVKQGITFNAIGNEPRPIPSPAPPIWVGGATDRALQRAAQWGDGWMPYFSQPTTNTDISRSAIVSMDDFSEKVNRLKELRSAGGRSGDFDISVGAPQRPKSITHSEAQTIAGIAHELETRGATSMWTTVPDPSRAAYLEHVAWFGEEIISLFDQK